MGAEVHVKTDKFEGMVPVTQEKFKLVQDCWQTGCECEQVQNPTTKIIMWTIVAICLCGIMFDSFQWMTGSNDKKEKKKDKKEKKEKKDKKKKDKDSAKDSESSPDEPMASSDTPPGESEDSKKEKSDSKKE